MLYLVSEKNYYFIRKFAIISNKFAIIILKNSSFSPGQGVVQMEPNSRYRVSHMYLEGKTERIFAVSFLGKKLACHTEICDYFQYLILKYSFSHRVKKLFK